MERSPGWVRAIGAAVSVAGLMIALLGPGGWSNGWPSGWSNDPVRSPSRWPSGAGEWPGGPVGRWTDPSDGAGAALSALAANDWHWPPGRWPTTLETDDRTATDQSTVDAGRTVAVLDPFATAAGTVRDLHGGGRPAVCYLRPSVWEADRPDAARFADTLLGDQAPGGGRWLDLRRWDQLVEPLSDRLDLCATKGFDGVALGDLDSFTQATGFDLTSADQLRFNNAVVGLAHARGLPVVLRPTPQTPRPPGIDVIVSPPAPRPS